MIIQQSFLFRHFDVTTTKEVESLHCFFVFGWTELKFGVGGGGNFRLLISNLNPIQARLFYRLKVQGGDPPYDLRNH